jgi:hypothetical protein
MKTKQQIADMAAALKLALEGDELNWAAAAALQKAYYSLVDAANLID